MNNWVTAHAEQYLAERARDGRPFFLSVGFFDPHHPFDPVEPYASMFDPREMPLPVYRPGEEDDLPPPGRERFDAHRDFCLDGARIRGTIAAYHAMVAHVDAMVGRLMEALRRTGLEHRTAVVFTSDHGEMLGDHGILHKGPLFYRGAVQVPLIWRLPEGLGPRGVVDEGFASHVDFAPTVSALAGVPGPRLVQGSPLLGPDGVLRPVPPRDAALVEWREKAFGSEEPFAVARCLVSSRWKYVCWPGQAYGELYDRQADPIEVRNLWHSPAHAGVRVELRRRLEQFVIESEPCPLRTDLF